MVCRPFVVLMFAAGVAGFGAGAVSAQPTSTGSGQAYPNKVIRIMTGNAGGGSDWVARLVAQEISGPLGQPVIVENRTALISTDTASKAAPDGHTLLVTGESLWSTPLLRKDAPYDPVRDLAPISLITRQVNLVAVHPSVPAKSIKELIALAKARPGELNYAFSGVGGNSHLSSELFKSMAGVNIVAVGYKGLAAATTALMSGEVHLSITDSGVLAPHIASGKMRALAVTSAEPSALAPGLPTVAATGLPGYETIAVTGIWAPGKTPEAIVRRLNQELVRFLGRPEMKERFFKAGSEIVANSPEQFAAHIKNDIAKLTKVIKDVGIKVD